MNSPNANNHPLRILSAVDLHNINDDVTDHPTMVRDHQVLQSAVRRPYLILFGQEQFPTLIDKAAVTMHSLAAHHIFTDGNKRTAVRAAEIFLIENGMQPTWSSEEVIPFVLNIARGTVPVEEVALWIAERVEEVTDDDTTI